MPDRTNLVYTYDGSFEGFLCCVFESYQRKEIPLDILSPSGQPGLFDSPEWVKTNPQKAERVYDSIPRRISAEAQELVKLGFLTCVPQKELLIFRFLQLGYKVGEWVMNMLTDDRVYPLRKAVGLLTHESHKLTGFIRFSVFKVDQAERDRSLGTPGTKPEQTSIYREDSLSLEKDPERDKNSHELYQRGLSNLVTNSFTRSSHLAPRTSTEVLVAVIEPKNFVLPLLAAHFCDRFRNEMFMIYDKTHKAALIYQEGKAEIIQVDNLILPETDKEEEEYRRLWKRFYETIAIDSRYNPRCRMTLMPKRYWRNMTEFS